MNEMIKNLEKIHTTKMGTERIKRNLKLETNDVVGYCKARIMDKDCKMERKGKNWYCKFHPIRLTIHATSYTIITAHQKGV